MYYFLLFLSFQNSFQSKSFFVVHPEWLSETVDNTDSEPLNRPPWPWEQPRYRQNIQIPITYELQEESAEQEPETETTEAEETEKRSPLPLPYALPKDYTFAHPGFDAAKPYEKTTCFGAPVVDTTQYKLGY